MKNINSAEIELVLSELELEGSLIEDIRQHNFSDLTFTFYTKKGGRVHLFVSLSSHLYIFSTDTKGRSTEKLQRFIQFCRANVFPSRVKSVDIVKGEREIRFTISVGEVIKYLYIRLFSGSKANVIVTDDKNIIEESFFRRPAEGIIKGKKFVQSCPRDIVFEIRPRIEGLTFNQQLRKEAENDAGNQSTLQYSLMLLEKHYSIYRKRIASKIESIKIHMEKTDISFLQDKADELSCTSQDGVAINEAYNKVKEAKRILAGEKEHIIQLQQIIENLDREYSQISESSDIAEVKAFDIRIYSQISHNEAIRNAYPIPAFKSADHIIFCARNAKENDILMRKMASGNDTWFHVRGSSGGYVIIKAKSGKSIPLSVLLDAAELALYFSSQRGCSSVDLHKTQVKYLKRIKGAKLGLVEVIRDESFFLKSDPARLSVILDNKI